MAILMVRSNGSVIEMPDGAEQFHTQLRDKNQAMAVDKRLGRTYLVKSTQGGLNLTEQPRVEHASQASVLIRAVKLPMNK